MENQKKIIQDIKKLVKTPGYIYVLSWIVVQDIWMPMDKIEEHNPHETISIQEASFLTGFLVQDQISYKTPSKEIIVNLANQTRKLLSKLHASFFSQNIKSPIELEKHNILAEAIFYASSGAYDFQYLELLEDKYKYDKEWLIQHKKFDISQSKEIVTQISHIIEKQYVKLFKENKYEPEDILNALTFKISDIQINYKIDSFLNNFSIIPNCNTNQHFNEIGDFNEFEARPIIRIDYETYFIPILFLLSKSLYESPFYWIKEIDSTYFSGKLTENRGKTGEEMCYKFLAKIFGEKSTLRSINISTKKGENDTEIDILCLLGNKALCFQVKSKKLTMLAKKGDDNQLKNDFQKAAQAAYKQGLISREKILAKKAIFTDQNGNKITLNEEINEVYIVGCISEDYPSLTFQSRSMLQKNDVDPYPLFLTIFDLQVIAHYLNDPYEFLYYIRQRIGQENKGIADDELCFLGYHMKHKIHNAHKYDALCIQNGFVNEINEDYISYKKNYKRNKILSISRSKSFQDLYSIMKKISQPKITDVIFYLMDLSSKGINDLVKLMKDQRQKAILLNKSGDFTLIRQNNSSLISGTSYIILNFNDLDLLKTNLLNHSNARKYKTKADKWLGFASFTNSNQLVDAVCYLEYKHEYNKKLETLTKQVLHPGTFLKFKDVKRGI